MSRPVSPRTVAVGFAVAFALLAALVVAVGVDDLLAVFARADAGGLLLAVAAGLGWLVAWGTALHAVFAAVGVRSSWRRSLALYGSVVFANNVAPFAQLGTEPLAALAITRSTGSRYETSLAAVVAVDALNVATSAVLASLGLAYISATAPLEGALRAAGLLAAALITAAVAAGVAGWWFRRRLGGVVAGAVAAAARAAGRFVPSWTPPTVESVERRVASFLDDLDRLAGDPRRLGVGTLCSAAGWALLAAALWLSLYAVGARVSPVAPLVVVPLSMLAVLVPLPGGVGSVEAALVVLVVGATGVPPVTATAAALVYRGVTYWLSVVLGGGVTAIVQYRVGTA
ncbi:MAG: YbhN family protein [Halobacteriaceae archaeon]